MPPIIELWSPVEKMLFGPKLVDRNNSRDDLKENGLVGKKQSLQASGKWLNINAAEAEAGGSSSHHLDIVQEEGLALENEFINDVMNCDAGIDTRTDIN